MANTSYLTKTVEPYLRDWAARKIGKSLIKKKVKVGKNISGKQVFFEFDGVSADGKTGVCISASSSYKTGQMRKYFMEATLLNRVRSFKRRIMVFTNQNSWDGFKNQCDGMVDLKKIEPLICSKLPVEMSKEIKRIYKISADEVRGKSGPDIKPPGRRK